MTETISLVTSIAACLSAIAALVVVRQNYKQRTASYRPELVLVKTMIELQSFEETKGFPHVANENYSSGIVVPLVNVGLGAARDLKISWRFPVDKVVSLANRLAQGSSRHSYFEYKNGRLSTKLESTWVIMWEVEREAEIDYVLPASIQQSPTNQLRIPLAYVALVAGLHHFVFKSQDSEFPDVPPLECRLEYSDIGGAKHGVDLLVQMKMFMIGVDGSGFVIQSEQRAP